jgi:hypothetical protein
MHMVLTRLNHTHTPLHQHRSPIFVPSAPVIVGAPMLPGVGGGLMVAPVVSAGPDIVDIAIVSMFLVMAATAATSSLRGGSGDGDDSGESSTGACVCGVCGECLCSVWHARMWTPHSC